MNQKRNLHYLSYGLFSLMGLLFLPFWKPLIIAGIFALALYPLLVKYSKSNVVPHKMVIGAVSFTTLLIITPVLMGTYSISSKIVQLSKSNDPVLKSNNLSKILITKFHSLSDSLGLPKSIKSSNVTEKIGDFAGEGIVSFASEIISSVPAIAINLFIFSLLLYLMLLYPLDLKKKIQNWNLLKKSDLDEFIKVLQTSCSQCLLSLIIVGFVQSAIVVIGSMIAGFSSSAVLIFLITFICSFIPVIGAAPVAFLLGMWKLSMGESGWGFFMIFIALLAGTIDNVLKPLLVKRGIELDAIITLVSIIGALIVFGLPGLFIGPVVATTAGYYFFKEIEEE